MADRHVGYHLHDDRWYRRVEHQGRCQPYRWDEERNEFMPDTFVPTKPDSTQYVRVGSWGEAIAMLVLTAGVILLVVCR